LHSRCSTAWVIPPVPLRTFVCKFLHGLVFSVPQGLSLGMQLLGDKESLCVTWPHRFACPWAGWGVPSPHSLPNIPMVCLCCDSHLVGLRWYLRMVWICISLLTEDPQCLFLYFLGIYMCLEKCPSESFFNFVFRFLIFLPMSCMLAHFR
jgi:hypothetical protein